VLLPIVTATAAAHRARLREVAPGTDVVVRQRGKTLLHGTCAPPAAPVHAIRAGIDAT
jgi:hypothetical protein